MSYSEDGGRGVLTAAADEPETQVYCRVNAVGLAERTIAVRRLHHTARRGRRERERESERGGQQKNNSLLRIIP